MAKLTILIGLTASSLLFSLNTPASAAPHKNIHNNSPFCAAMKTIYNNEPGATIYNHGIPTKANTLKEDRIFYNDLTHAAKTTTAKTKKDLLLMSRTIQYFLTHKKPTHTKTKENNYTLAEKYLQIHTLSTCHINLTGNPANQYDTAPHKTKPKPPHITNKTITPTPGLE